MQVATVALADSGLIPVTLPSMIDMDKTHTYLATNVAHTSDHQDRLAVPGLVLWKSCLWLQAVLVLDYSVEHRGFKLLLLTCVLPEMQKLVILTFLLPLIFFQTIAFELLLLMIHLANLEELFCGQRTRAW